MCCQLHARKPFVCVFALVLLVVPALSADILRSSETTAAMEYRFSPADEKLLDETQQACFRYFWVEVGTPSGLAKDRLKAPVASIASVGFQLSGLAIGVERKWITRVEGEQRARTILRTLLERTDNKKFGVYIHYPDLNTGGLSKEGFEILPSTVDHALLLAGAITAGEYFGSDVKALADRMVAETNWKAFAVAPGGYLTMGWAPDDPNTLSGPGKFTELKWDLASDEERLIYFLGVGSPRPDYRIPPEMYYQLKRFERQHKDMSPFIVSWPGALFTYFFSHCWIDFRTLGADDPSRLKVDRPRVDWFENSRRAVLTHRQRCIELGAKYKTLSADRWGLSACVGRNGYIVPEVRPNLSNNENVFAGTVAPYAAGSAIMFTPAESVVALRAFRQLRDERGKPLVWRDPADGGYGFVDAFNLEERYACDDYVGIDHGPMLLAIENARTGLIWRLFMGSDTARRAVERLRLTPGQGTSVPARATDPN
jgi:hypothetical protein